MARQISAQALDLLKVLEGKVVENGLHVPYDDQAGLRTIGYGHLIKNGESFPPEGISEDDAESLLRTDLAHTEQGVEGAVTADLNDNQFGALVIFAFNIGLGGFRDSTALRRVNGGEGDVPEAMRMWNKITDPNTGRKVVSNGLVNRRNAEVALYETPPG